MQIALLIRISTTKIILRPVQFDLGRPKIVTQILDEFDTYAEEWKIPARIEQLSPPDVQSYVQDVLLKDHRNLPVIMISPDVWSNAYAVSGEGVFNKVRGFAHVAVLKDKWAAFTLTDAVQKPLSCYDGAVRIYWPGFQLTDSPFQHKLFFRQSIRLHAEEGVPLEEHLFRLLATVSSYRFIEGQVIAGARDALSDEERRKVDDLRQQIKSGHVEKENLEIQLLDALEQIDRLTKERDKSKAELAAQQAAWAEVQQSMGTTESESEVTQVTEVGKIQTVIDAIQKAKSDFSGPLLFLESAMESGKDSPFKDPDRLYSLLEALWIVADEWKKRSGKLGKSWNDAMRDLGFDFRDQVSNTSKGKYGEQYHFVYKGKKELFEKHVTIGSGQPDTCLSVHVFRDDDDLVLVIGHCGRHLKNTKS